MGLWILVLLAYKITMASGKSDYAQVMALPDGPMNVMDQFNSTSLESLLGKVVEGVVRRHQWRHENSTASISIWSFFLLLLAIFISLAVLFFVTSSRTSRDRVIRRKTSQRFAGGQRKNSRDSNRLKYTSKLRRKTSQVINFIQSESRKTSVDHEIIFDAKLITAPSPAERDMEERIQTPMTEQEFTIAMKEVIDFITNYYQNPEEYPVSPDIQPNDIFNQLPQQAPENPETFSLVWNDFHEIIMKGCIQWQHPRFHAFFPCGRSYPDILAETLISSLGTVGITWAANPAVTELDSVMVNWLGRALGIPESFLFQGSNTTESEGGGWLADTASDTIFCAIMAARHCKIEEELANVSNIDEKAVSNRELSDKHMMRADIMSKLVAYGSYEGHSSFEKACKMACVQWRHIEVYEEDDWGMRRDTVEKEMEKDIRNGLIPFYLHVALGTTSTASSDHLVELTPLREKFGLWIHVDAAYAGSAWVVEKYRNNEGIAQVDSINVNLHKFFLTSASVTPFWTRHQKKYKEFFHVQPAYLKKTGGTDLRDWGIQLTRRFKSLKVYMLLRVYGIKGMRAYVERIIGMTEYMEKLLVKIPNIRKFGRTNYGIFCVQYHEEGMIKEQVNNATKSLCEFINNSREMYFTHSDVRGHDIIRVAVTMERSTKKDVEESVKIFIKLVDEFKQKMHEVYVSSGHTIASSISKNSSTSSFLQDALIIDSSMISGSKCSRTSSDESMEEVIIDGSLRTQSFYNLS